MQARVVPVRRLRRPLPPPLLASDVWAVGGFVVAVTLGLWIRHGGLSTLLGGGVDTLRGLGQFTGFVAALAALGGLLLTARPAWLERRFGLDGMLAAHRWFGIVTVFSVAVHAIVDTWAWADATAVGFFGALGDLLTNESWMVAALVGTVLVVVIGLTSWRRIRATMSYETWYFVHTLGYLAVLLAFGHQLTLGTDIASDRVFWWWWVGLAATGAALVAWSRLGAIVTSLTRPVRVTAVAREAHGIGSLHVNGPGLQAMRVAGGQFFIVRPLARGLWWQAHPFSVSAAPTDAGLRFTIKELGDDTPAFLRLRPGTRVLLEGPYGTFTADAAHGRKVVLVAGGVGVAPIRAILEDCRPDQEPVVVVRVRHEADLAHRGELERLVAARGGRLHVPTGPRELFVRNDPFAPATLRAWIPDLADRHAFVCGPASLESAVMSGLRRAGMPVRHIHHEQFGD